MYLELSSRRPTLERQSSVEMHPIQPNIGEVEPRWPTTTQSVHYSSSPQPSLSSRQYSDDAVFGVPKTLSQSFDNQANILPTYGDQPTSGKYLIFFVTWLPPHPFVVLLIILTISDMTSILLTTSDLLASFRLLCQKWQV